MKRILVQAFCFGIIALGGTHLGAQEALAPSTEIGGGEETNYQTCMKYCMPGHTFDYCHGQCKSLA
jgi:hypothetical protein